MKACIQIRKYAYIICDIIIEARDGAPLCVI